MALRSVLEIEVKDDTFKEFRGSFDKYHDLVKQLPDDWGKVSKKISETRDAMKAMVLEAMHAKLHSQQMLVVQREADRLLAPAETRWSQIAKHSKLFSENITVSTQNFLKWVGPLSLLGPLMSIAGAGALGAAGLFGIPAFIGSAMYGLRGQTMGIGMGNVSPGAWQSFGINFGRILGGQGGAENLISMVGRAQSGDTEAFGALMAGGRLSPEQITHGNAADIAVSYLRGLRTNLAGKDTFTRGSLARSYQVDKLGLSPEQVNSLANMKGPEFEQLVGRYKAGISTLDIQDKQLKAWQDFIDKMGEAGKQIEIVFGKALVPLAPQIAELSTAVAGLVAAILGTGGFREAIVGITHNLQVWSDWMSSKFGVSKDSKGGVQLAPGFSLSGPLADAVEWLHKKITGEDLPTISPFGNVPNPFADQGMNYDSTNAGAPRTPMDVLRSQMQAGGASVPGSGPTIGDRYNNPGNIGYGNFAARFGGTAGTVWDTGHAIAVFPNLQTGYKAMEQLLRSKYASGQHTLDEIIAGQGGWTPGNYIAAGNIARYMGVSPNQDLNLNDRAQMRALLRGLSTQEGSTASWRRFERMNNPYQDNGAQSRIEIYNQSGANVVSSAFASVIG